MFLEISCTVYDPQKRDLDLKKELDPYWVSGRKWENGRMVGVYVSCGRYYVHKFLAEKGMVFIKEDGSSMVPEFDPNQITFETTIFRVLANMTKDLKK